VVDGSRYVVRRGDCLTLVPELARDLGPFQLIYVDPPFNAGGQRRARGRGGARAEGVAAYRDAWGGIDGFLHMLAPRLEAFHAALAATGSLWLHLDHRAVHEAKVLADSILGRNAFAAEVIWVPGNGSRRRTAPSVTHQTLLVFKKGARMTWNTHEDALREPFAETSRRMHFQKTTADGRHYRERQINGKVYRYFADRGRLLGSVWTDCPAMTANTPLRAETTGYPTQKPESLLRRIVIGTTAPGDTVLDPMCGSGTTLAAAVALGRRAAGCDRSALACRITRQRLRSRGNA
jgi:site-specific DNA-methyltransferase (adenine-specific)